MRFTGEQIAGKWRIARSERMNPTEPGFEQENTFVQFNTDGTFFVEYPIAKMRIFHQYQPAEGGIDYRTRSSNEWSTLVMEWTEGFLKVTAADGKSEWLELVRQESG